MSKLDMDFSFRRNISHVKHRDCSASVASLPRGLGVSEVNLNNTSRFQEKKVLRRLKEQDLINRIANNLQRTAQNDLLVKQAYQFKPVRSDKKDKKDRLKQNR